MLLFFGNKILFLLTFVKAWLYLSWLKIAYSWTRNKTHCHIIYIYIYYTAANMLLLLNAVHYDIIIDYFLPLVGISEVGSREERDSSIVRFT